MEIGTHPARDPTGRPTQKARKAWVTAGSVCVGSNMRSEVEEAVARRAGDVGAR